MCLQLYSMVWLHITTIDDAAGPCRQQVTELCITDPIAPVTAAAAACGGVPLQVPFLATVRPSHSAWHLGDGIWCQ